METKRCKVVMLPTRDNRKGRISLGLSGALHNSYSHPDNENYKNFHLYIVSDDDIKKGDWACHSSKGYREKFINDKNIIVKCTESNRTSIQEHWKKIIATTDKSLKIPDGVSYGQECPLGLYGDDGLTYVNLPSPSEAFIKKYCEAGGIDEVDVEYEVQGNKMYSQNKEDENKPIYGIKVDPHNTITIHPIKDSWTREEVEELIYQAMKSRTYTTIQEWKDWIKENL